MDARRRRNKRARTTLLFFQGLRVGAVAGSSGQKCFG